MFFLVAFQLLALQTKDLKQPPLQLSLQYLSLLRLLTPKQRNQLFQLVVLINKHCYWGAPSHSHLDKLLIEITTNKKKFFLKAAVLIQCFKSDAMNKFLGLPWLLTFLEKFQEAIFICLPGRNQWPRSRVSLCVVWAGQTAHNKNYKTQFDFITGALTLSRAGRDNQRPWITQTKPQLGEDLGFWCQRQLIFVVLGSSVSLTPKVV